MMSWRVLLILVALTGQKDAPRLDDLLARVARPTVVQSAISDLPSNGFVWVDGANGSVARTSLTLTEPETNVSAEITVDYRPNPKLTLWVRCAWWSTTRSSASSTAHRRARQRGLGR